MNDQDNPQTDKPRWVAPEVKEVSAALDYFRHHRQKSVVLTLVLKLGGNSRSKEQAVLEAQAHATNMTSALLRLLQEDSKRPNPKGAITYVLQMLEKTQGRRGNQVRVLGDILSTQFSKQLSIRDYLIPGSIRTGVFRNCALMILNWCQRIGNLKDLIGDTDEDDSGSTTDDAGKKITVSDSKDLFLQWRKQREEFEAAAAKVMPFGRNRGKPLGEVGNRDLRWLLERLPADEVVEKTLHAIEELLYTDPNNQRASLRAKLTPHPWRRATRQEYAPRSRYFEQRHHKLPGPPIRLGRLNKNELLRLRDELRELQQFAEEIAELRVAVKTMLHARPSKFPSVQPAPLNDIERQQRYDDFQSALETFYDPFPRKVQRGTEHMVSATRLKTIEDKRKAQFLRSAGAIDVTKLQPLSFTRTIRPPDINSFALLYDQVTGAYALAVVIHGKHSTAKFTPKTSSNLYYVNYPKTPFIPPQEKSCLVFSVEYGRDYQDAKYLKALLDRQREEQERLYNRRTKEDMHLPIAEFLPKGAIGSAKLLTQHNTAGRVEMYVHLPIEVRVPSCDASPTTVIGFHEHDDGYSYAILTLTGEVLECGDIQISQKLCRIKDNGGYSSNYAFEMAVAMTKLGAKHNAYIGLEETFWKRQPTLSRAINRERFRRPRKKIAEILKYKAPLAGLLRPQLIRGVSPKRACGSCGTTVHHNSVRRRPTITCYACGSSALTQNTGDDVTFHCLECDSTWNSFEEQFRCAVCSTHQLARYNTAVVVAKYALTQLVAYHKGILEQKEQNDRKRKTNSK